MEAFKSIAPKVFSFSNLSVARVRLPSPVILKSPVENDTLSSTPPSALNSIAEPLIVVTFGTKTAPVVLPAMSERSVTVTEPVSDSSTV